MILLFAAKASARRSKLESWPNILATTHLAFEITAAHRTPDTFVGGVVRRAIADLIQGGVVGMGKSIHAGEVIVADGSPLAADRLRRVLTADPGIGVVRHADAGYPRAIEVAQENAINMPMLASPRW